MDTQTYLWTPHDPGPGWMVVGSHHGYDFHNRLWKWVGYYEVTNGWDGTRMDDALGSCRWTPYPEG